MGFLRPWDFFAAVSNAKQPQFLASAAAVSLLSPDSRSAFRWGGRAAFVFPALHDHKTLEREHPVFPVLGPILRERHEADQMVPERFADR